MADMADIKITDLPVLAALADDDVFEVVDVSDQTDSPEGSSVQVTREAFLDGTPRVTARNPATGQLQINGVEMGDTGWRDVSASLDSGFTGTVHIRRVGSAVSVVCAGLIAPGSQRVFYTLPSSGWRNVSGTATADYSRSYWPGVTTNTDLVPTRWLRSGGAAGQSLTVTDLAGTDLVAAATTVTKFNFITTDVWPSSLPGSQVTAPASGG